MTMTSRNSSDSSLDGQENTVSSKSSARKSLDQLLSQNKRMREVPPDNVADMPSLSSFRADEMSASAASRGDCDQSLPSLSSFRLDDLSMCSSYHSMTNHLSEDSAEGGWSSFTSGTFTSGNVSADTESDGGEESEFATKSSSPCSNQGEPEGSSMPARSSSPVRNENPLKAAEEDGCDINLTSNARPPARRTAGAEETQHSLPMRRPTRTVSPPRDERPSEPEVSADAKSNARPPRRRSASPGRTPVERTESLPLIMLQRPTKAKEIGSSSSIRTGTEGSSSSLRGGDSLPRLPRRSSTIEDHSKHAEDDDDNDTKVSDDRSRISDDDTRISDDDVSRISDDGISIDSDEESDYSVDDETDDDNIEERKPLDEVTSPPDDGTKPSDDETKPSDDGTKPSDDRTKPLDDGTKPSDDPVKSSADTLEQSKEETEQAEDQTTAENTTNPNDEAGLPPLKNRESPTSVRAIEETLPAKAPDESGTVSAEESGTSATDTEVDESSEEIPSEKEQKEVVNKRGNLLKKMSTSFRNIGKTTSFRNPFKMIGRSASKLTQKGRKDDKDGSRASQTESQPTQYEALPR